MALIRLSQADFREIRGGSQPFMSVQRDAVVSGYAIMPVGYENSLDKDPAWGTEAMRMHGIKTDNTLAYAFNRQPQLTWADGTISFWRYGTGGSNRGSILFGRLQGTLSTDNCYALVTTSDTKAFVYKGTVGKVLSGTKLWESDSSSILPLDWENLRLDISTSGTQASIDVYRNTAVIPGDPEDDPGDFETWTKLNASPILDDPGLSAGRWGFGMASTSTIIASGWFDLIRIHRDL